MGNTEYIIENDIKSCSCCGLNNTEAARFNIKQNGSILLNQITFRPNSYIKRVVYRYLLRILRIQYSTDILLCQKCISKFFRNLRKDK